MAKQDGSYKDDVVIRVRGKAVFPALTTPETKFKALGVYKTGVALDAEDDRVAELTKQMDDMLEKRIAHEKAEVERKGLAPKRKQTALEAIEPTEDRCYKLEVDKDGEETGRWVLNCKANAAYMDKKTGKAVKRAPPVVVDAQRKPVTAEVWGGSEIIVNCTLSTFFTAIGVGVRCQLNGVQVLSLATGVRGDPNAMFDEEDGYVADAPAKVADEDEAEATETDMD
jgi:hypothetical protein